MKARKTTTMGIRVTPEQRAEITRLARESGMSQSDFIVAKALGRPYRDVTMASLRRRIRELEGWTGLERRPRREEPPAAPVPQPQPQPQPQPAGEMRVHARGEVTGG